MWNVRAHSQHYAWRKIAWSTPKLWNKLYLFIDSAKISEQNRLDIVQQWLSRSGDLMINIYAEYSNCRGWNSEWDSDYEPQIILLEKDIHPYPIIDIINHYAHRWGELYLHLPALLLSQFRATSEAPRLQTVFLMPTADELPEQADDHVWLIREARPQTVHLDLQKWDLSVLKFDFKFEWNAVTRLTLWRVHEALCVKIMMQAPELTHFDISTFVDQDQDQDQIVSAPIVHPKIQFFRYMSDQLYPGFRPPLHLPSLEEFNCGVTLCSQAQTNWLKSSLERSPSLQRLRLSVILAGGEELIDVLKRLPSVQHLQITFGQFTLSRFTSYTADCASMLFKHLSKTSIPDHPHPTNFLPNLESLECVFYTIDVPWSHISSIFGPCSEIGNPRRRPFMSLTVFDGRSQFLGASELKFDEIDKDVVLQFIKLKDAGVNIVISHGFVEKDMLKPLIERHKADVGVGA